jgi:hypothetical protein
LVDGAAANDEADEIEDEREVRDESETIDSGEDAVETVLASDERRTKFAKGFGGDVLGAVHRSRH